MAEHAPTADSVAPADDALNRLSARFGDALQRDTRPGYEGLIAGPEQLVAVATALRDELGYDYLASATAVDYLGKGDHLEMVYHLCRIAGGPPLALKAQTPREVATLPSLIGVWPGADFQEREAWDLMGIRFEGHPDLRRILMWEGFAGHPLRKDWKEAYFEQEQKPFDSRWPGGHVRRAEELVPYGRNVKYPDDFSPDAYDGENLADAAAVRSLTSLGPGVDVEQEGTDRVVVNLGPQHPSTHGVLRLMLELEGETVLRTKPIVGYLHTGMEKTGEELTYLQGPTNVTRMDYASPLFNELAFSLTTETLLGIADDIPERAQWIRMLMTELNRITSHLLFLATNGMDVGAVSMMLYGWRDREEGLRVLESITGLRMNHNYIRPGGVAVDLPDGWRDDVLRFIDAVPESLDEYDVLLTGQPIYRERLQGVGVITPEEAVALGATGPILRSTGVAWDLRRDVPYLRYDQVDFDVVVGTYGDCFDRYAIRLNEMRESIRIVRQVLEKLPKGDYRIQDKKVTPPPRARIDESMEALIHHFKIFTEGFKVPEGEAYCAVESPRGELGCYIVSDGSAKPYRMHVRGPSFANLQTLPHMMRGGLIADAVAVISSVDPIMGEVDR